MMTYVLIAGQFAQYDSHPTDIIQSDWKFFEKCHAYLTDNF
jgi:hypothetical protein